MRADLEERLSKIRATEQRLLAKIAFYHELKRQSPSMQRWARSIDRQINEEAKAFAKMNLNQDNQLNP